MTIRQVEKAIRYERQFAGVPGTNYSLLSLKYLTFALRYLRSLEV